MSRLPMSRRLFAASWLFVVACGGGRPAPAPSSGVGTPAPEEAAAAPPVPGAAADAAPVAGYTDIGIPECDQFARKYLACIDKVPETTRAMVRQMDEEGFGGCTNHGECQAVCPQGISIKVIGELNRDYRKAMVHKLRARRGSIRPQ